MNENRVYTLTRTHTFTRSVFYMLRHFIYIRTCWKVCLRNISSSIFEPEANSKEIPWLPGKSPSSGEPAAAHLPVRLHLPAVPTLAKGHACRMTLIRLTTSKLFELDDIWESIRAIRASKKDRVNQAEITTGELHFVDRIRIGTCTHMQLPEEKASSFWTKIKFEKGENWENMCNLIASV